MNLLSNPKPILQVFLVFGLLVNAGCSTSSHKSNFLQCRTEVKLEGTIEDKVFPGPPNYKDISKGDEPEDYWILKLREPINVAEDPEYPVLDEDKPDLNVREIQLNMDVHLDSDYNAYQQFLGKGVEVVGELTQGFTVHHKTAVLIDVREIRMR
jgi:hypothetical protein